MSDDLGVHTSLGDPLRLPCGSVLKNRIAKAAMSDSLGNGRGDATEAQARLYARWARGGVGLSIVGGPVAAHGGRIDVGSEPGEGTAFRVRLPRRAEPGKGTGSGGDASQID